MKKLKLLFTALLLLCCVGTAKAEEVTINGIKYDVITDTKQATVISGGNYSGNIVIPNEITYNNVTCSVASIGDYAFRYCSGLTSVTIPNSVTSIGNWAFYGCSGLTSVTIPNSVTSIGTGAFNGCSGLTSITIPNSVTSIGIEAFCRCGNLKSVKISSSIKKIEKGTFSRTGLTSVIIPEGVTSLGIWAFDNSPELATVELPSTLTSIEDFVFENCPKLTNITIPNSLTNIGNDVFKGCLGLKTVINFSNLTFSEGTNDNGYVAYYADKVINAPNGSIEGDFIWYETDSNNVLACYLGDATELTLPTDYKGESYVVGKNAFYGNKTITSITIPNNVISIGDYAFYGCDELKRITNFSNLKFSEGSISNGYVAYYADKVINAPNGSIEGDFIWYETDSNNVLACYLGDATELTLPDNYNGKSYEIGENAFYRNKTIKSIIIPNSVTSIGVHAFQYCENLKSVTIPNSVTSIGEGAFGYTGITSITIPNSVKTIGVWAFEDCYNLTNIAIPNSVTSIGECTFIRCYALTSIMIPNSVTSIGKKVFENCSSLESIVVDPNNAKYDSRNNCNAIIETESNTLIAGCKKSVIPNSVTSIGDYAFFYCSGLTSITIPNSVTSIGIDAFYGCENLKSVTIPNSVTSIGDYAFYYCTGLKTVINFSNLAFTKGLGNYGYVSYYADTIYNIPGGSRIDDFIFVKQNNVNTLLYYLGNEQNLNLPVNYEGESYIIGAYTFKNNTTITSIVIPNGVTCIGDYAFEGCSGLTSITIPNSVTSIGIDAFYGCYGLKSVINFSNLTFCEGLEGYGYIAYYTDKVVNAPNGSIEGDFIWYKTDNNNVLACYLGDATELTLPDNYNGKSYEIGENAFFRNKTITSITIPDCVASIGDYAFYECISLTSVTIGNSVTSIGDEAFYGCSGLTSITIPNSITSIGDYAFYDCTGLETVINFSNLAFTKGLGNYGYVAYYADKVVNAPNGTIIGDYVFSTLDGKHTLSEYLGNANEIILPENCKGEKYVIGNNVFTNNKTITSITIPNSVINIGSQAFYMCSGLKTVINHSNLTFSKGSSSNGYIAYYVNKVYNAPDGSIEGDYIFGKPNGLNTLLYYLGNEQRLNLPVNYEGESYIIGAYTFKNNTTITSIVIPNNVTSIGDEAFYNCEGLTSITIPNSVTSIGYRAFYGCSGLTSITIPNSVTSIGIKAFNGCSGLESIVVDKGNTTYDSRDNCNSLIETRNNRLIVGCKKSVIPNNVTSIGDGAFYGCSGLTSITIPNSVTSIGIEAFYGCSGLTSITIPNSVTSIGYQAFAYCSGLTSVTIGDGVTSFGNEIFYKCSSLKSIVVEKGNTKYDSRDNCNAIIETESNTLIVGCKKSVIPNSVTNIRSRAFYDCSGLTNITIPNSVTSIGLEAFCRCGNLKSVKISSSITKIEQGVFSRTGLTSVIIPEGVTSLSLWAFDNSPELATIELPSTLTSIGDFVFENCPELTNITIPDCVTSIGISAFANCKNLTDVYCLATNVPSTNSDAFKGSYPEHMTLHVPAEAINSYKKTAPWSRFGNIVEIANTDIINIPAKAVFVTSNNGTINISCSLEGENVAVYSSNAMFIGSTTIENGCASIQSGLSKGNIAIVKIGEKSIKVIID